MWSSPSTSTSRFSGSNDSLRIHSRISSPFIRRDSPHASTKRRATSSASSSRSSLSRNELIDRLTQREEIGQLGRRLGGRLLAEADHPYAAQTALVRRGDVLEDPRRDVDVPLARRVRPVEELLQCRCAGLYEPISCETTTSSNGTPMFTCDAAMKSVSVLER